MLQTLAHLLMRRTGTAAVAGTHAAIHASMSMGRFPPEPLLATAIPDDRCLEGDHSVMSERQHIRDWACRGTGDVALQAPESGEGGDAGQLGRVCAECMGPGRAAARLWAWHSRLLRHRCSHARQPAITASHRPALPERTVDVMCVSSIALHAWGGLEWGDVVLA